jgi:hypothetical protein
MPEKNKTKQPEANDYISHDSAILGDVAKLKRKKHQKASIHRRVLI